MKLLRVFVCIGSTAAITLTTQIIQAQPQSESKYLASISRAVSTFKELSRTHASIPTEDKVKYGYKVCRALDKKETMSNIRDSIYTSEFTANEKTYFMIMGTFAILDLCPEYKPLLKT